MTSLAAAVVQEPATSTTFADRIKYRLEEMLAHPYSFLSSYAKRYETLMQYAGTTLPAPALERMTKSTASCA